MKNNLTFFVFIVIGIFSVTAAAPNWGVADTLEHYEIGPGIESSKSDTNRFPSHCGRPLST